MSLSLRKILFIASLLLAINVHGEQLPADSTASKTESFSYIPELHGAFRGRFEQSTQTGEGRFQVRNFRLSIEGKVAPIISYRAQVDLCDRGKMKILDAWARITPYKGLRFQVGQFREPFGYDAFRGPGNYIFANRAFLVKNMANVRGVGVQVGYTLPTIPLTFEASMFNPTNMNDHDKWVKKYAYAAKASFAPGDWNFTAGFMSLRPELVRINLFNAAARWTNGTVLVESEYTRKHYTNNAHRPSNGFLFFADWGLPVNVGVFDRWSVQGRFDTLSRHSDGLTSVDGKLTTTENSRSRITLGSTLTYKWKRLRCDVRLNYEQFFYGHGGRMDERGNRIVAELVVAY